MALGFMRPAADQQSFDHTMPEAFSTFKRVRHRLTAT
jgi:hypothetical protein